MTGLLKNNLYGAIGNIFVLSLLFLVFGAFFLITGDASYYYPFVLISVSVFPCSAFSSFRKEAAGKWNKYELTAPIRRKDIIKSRYISHLLWTLGAALLLTFFTAILIFAHGNRYFYEVLRDPISLCYLSIGISLLIGAFYYPFVYFAGAEKSEAGIIISVICAAILTAGIIFLINPANDIRLTDFAYFSRLCIYGGIVIIAYLISYLLTLFIYTKREYSV